MLKWAGGKSWLLPRLMQLYQPHRDRALAEPFVGGMNVALGLEPRRALLNDVNQHLINFYDQIAKGQSRFTLKMENEEFLYYRYRRCFNELMKMDGAWRTQTAAELFYYLNRTGFNGLCRFNNSGEFNVPFGKYNTITYRRDFSPYTKKLQNWYITPGSFDDFFRVLFEGAFVFADPPYDGTFVDYSSGGFSWNDQVRLAKVLAQYNGPVVATNQATERVLKLYTELGFTVEVVDAPRRISSNGNREPAKEMLATKGVN